MYLDKCIMFCGIWQIICGGRWEGEGGEVGELGCLLERGNGEKATRLGKIGELGCLLERGKEEKAT